MLELFRSADHLNVMFDDLGGGAMVQANQHVIVDHGEAMLLDPGGHKIYATLFGQLSEKVPMKGLKHLFFSHQDPDIVAAANGWLMVTDAAGHISSLWMRFITHFGVDRLVVDRLEAIPDEGKTIQLGETTLLVIPAHFLHSPGNFQVYDPAAKILYTGDFGASLGHNYSQVTDFDQHVPYMDGFHRRYLPSARAIKPWLKTVSALDIEQIVPQHGAIFQGRPLVERFLAWADGVTCWLDNPPDHYPLPR